MVWLQGNELKNHIGKMTENWGNHKDIIQKASGGALLRGTLHKLDVSDANEYTVTRRQLLKVPEDALVKGPVLPMKTGELQIESKEDYEAFEQSIENTEISLGAGVVFKGLWGSLGTGAERTNKRSHDLLKEDRCQNVFFSQIKYEVVPIASVQFDESTLRLRDEALDDLKEFCHLVWRYPKPKRKRKQKYKTCASFFEKFGSHANVGVFHLGGMLTWRSVFSAETESSLREIKTLVAASLQARVDAGFTGFGVGGEISVSAKTLEEHIQSRGEFDQTDIAKTIVSCTVYGGPPASASSEEWHEGLTTESATWIIIDRGDLNLHDHVGVWDILKRDPWFLENETKYTSMHNMETKETENALKYTDTQNIEEKETVSDAMYRIFQTWVYRKKIKKIIREVEHDPTCDHFYIGLLKIESENMRHLENGKPTNSWLDFLEDDDCVSKFLTKPPNLKAITRKSFRKIMVVTERLLADTSDIKNKQLKKYVSDVKSSTCGVLSRIRQR